MYNLRFSINEYKNSIILVCRMLNNWCMKKVDLFLGITAQFGSFLAELLIEKGYDVYSIICRFSFFDKVCIEHLHLNDWEHDIKKNRLVNLHYGELTSNK